MKITKTAAIEISRKLCKSKDEFIDLKKEEFSKEVYEYAFNKLPKELKDLFNDKKIRPYLKTVDNVYLIDLDRSGFKQFRYLNFLNRLPTTADHAYNSNFTFDEKDVSIYVEKARLINSLIEERDKLVKEIEVVLLSLNTYKQISEKFPEAIPYLPVLNNNTTLSIPIDSVRNKLNTK